MGMAGVIAEGMAGIGMVDVLAGVGPSGVRGGESG